ERHAIGELQPGTWYWSLTRAVECSLHFFFFQAEDGIRDGHVTGVQTCALPISFVTHVEAGKPGEVVAGVVRRTRCDALFAGAHVPHGGERPSVVVSHAEEILRHTDIPVVIQP